VGTREVQATEAHWTCQDGSPALAFPPVPRSAPVPFGARLRALREERGLTQEELAFATYDTEGRVSSGAIGQFERGVANPLPTTMAALARALGVGPEEFYEWRLARARMLLDERQVGLKQAVQHLDAIELAIKADGTPLEDFGRALEEAGRAAGRRPPKRAERRRVRRNGGAGRRAT
jgi:transcriptional regulator with XRE-family HTH domain